MGAITAKGLVLRETRVGEADKILTVLLKEYGKLSVSAKGARKTNSKFLSAAQLFCYADFVIYAGKGFYSLASAQPIENFYGMAADYERLRVGAYVAELADRTLMENLNCDAILYFLLVTLKNIEKGALAPEIIRGVFELKFLQLCGYSPEVGVCSECGGELIREARIGEYGALCVNCAGGGPRPALKISGGCLRAMRYILDQQANKIFSFSVDEKTGSELISAAGFLLRAHTDVRTRSGGIGPE